MAQLFHHTSAVLSVENGLMIGEVTLTQVVVFRLIAGKTAIQINTVKQSHHIVL